MKLIWNQIKLNLQRSRDSNRKLFKVTGSSISSKKEAILHVYVISYLLLLRIRKLNGENKAMEDLTIEI